MVRKTSGNTEYCLNYGNGEIDPGKVIGENYSLYLGAHLANDISHEGHMADKRKHYNAKFEDTLLVATSTIPTQKEICIDYNRE